MSILDGLTKNWAELSTDADDPDLRPLVVSKPKEEAVNWAAEIIGRQPRWSVVEADPEAGTLHATHTTKIWRFVDDIQLRFEPGPPGKSTRMVGRSQSRLGKGDLGQNARNLKMLTQALRGALT